MSASKLQSKRSDRRSKEPVSKRRIAFYVTMNGPMAAGHYFDRHAFSIGRWLYLSWKSINKCFSWMLETWSR